MPGTVVVTGSTGVMTSIFCREYASSHPEDHLILLMRNPEKVAPGTLPEESSTIEYKSMDLKSLSEVRSSCTEIIDSIKAGKHPPISALVCSATIQVTSRDQPRVTTEGHEETIAVNHLAHFIIIMDLLPAMQENGRVVVVGSDSHISDYEFFKMHAKYKPLKELLYVEPASEPPAEATDRGRQRYGTTKMQQMMIGHELARRVKNHPKYSKIQVVMFNPGSMATNLLRDEPFLTRTLFRFVLSYPRVLNYMNPNFHCSLPQHSAEALQRLVEDRKYALAAPMGEGLVGGAAYWDYDLNQIETKDEVNDSDKSKELWNDTAELLGYKGDVAIL